MFNIGLAMSPSTDPGSEGYEEAADHPPEQANDKHDRPAHDSASTTRSAHHVRETGDHHPEPEALDEYYLVCFHIFSSREPNLRAYERVRSGTTDSDRNQTYLSR